MNKNCLSEIEERKIERFHPLLSFLSRKEAIFFVKVNTFKFDPKTDSFHDNINGRVIAPESDLIDFFYKRLCHIAMNKLQVEMGRTKIPSIRRLLIKFNKLDFLPLAF